MKRVTGITTNAVLEAFTPIGDTDTLNAIYRMFSESPTLFRSRLNSCCLWSTPTFYRKIRDATKGKRQLSMVELQAIIVESRKTIAEMTAILDQAERKLKKTQIPKDMPLAKAI